MWTQSNLDPLAKVWGKGAWPTIGLTGHGEEASRGEGVVSDGSYQASIGEGGRAWELLELTPPRTSEISARKGEGPRLGVLM